MSQIGRAQSSCGVLGRRREAAARGSRQQALGQGRREWRGFPQCFPRKTSLVCDSWVLLGGGGQRLWSNKLEKGVLKQH